MHSLVFKILFHPVINRILSRIMKPFGSLIPERFRFPVCGFFKVKIPNGKHIQLEGQYTSFITRKLFWSGISGFEYNSVDIFLELIKSSKVFFDIGANIGYYSLLASKVNPGLEIFAFEPFPDAIAALKRNISQNMFGNISIISTALAAKTGEDTLFYRINDDFPRGLQLAGNNSMVNFKDNRNQTVDIKTQTLDEFVTQHKIESLDFIKIDTETTEFMILSNGIEALKKFRPIILCEVLPGHHEKKLEALFLSLDYVFCRVHKSGVTLQQKLNVVGEDENDFFFIPKEKAGVIRPFLITK
ncbi:MAG: FkbM family methyltransferase [Bacteroidales bacterium]|nr:FkbM family methyltransferase [Bacteroidales bacterium]MCF8402869.1 FkbM family methyltransferase [Bacteroidales bacterium]